MAFTIENIQHSIKETKERYEESHKSGRDPVTWMYELNHVKDMMNQHTNTKNWPETLYSCFGVELIFSGLLENCRMDTMANIKKHAVNRMVNLGYRYKQAGFLWDAYKMCLEESEQ